MTPAVVTPLSVSDSSLSELFPLVVLEFTVIGLEANCVARSGGVAIFVLKSNCDLGGQLVSGCKDCGHAGGKNRTVHISRALEVSIDYFVTVCERDVVAAEFVTCDDHEDVVLTDFCVNAIVLELFLICLIANQDRRDRPRVTRAVRNHVSVTVVAAVTLLQSFNDGRVAASTIYLNRVVIEGDLREAVRPKAYSTWSRPQLTHRRPLRSPDERSVTASSERRTSRHVRLGLPPQDCHLVIGRFTSEVYPRRRQLAAAMAVDVAVMTASTLLALSVTKGRGSRHDVRTNWVKLGRCQVAAVTKSLAAVTSASAAFRMGSGEIARDVHWSRQFRRRPRHPFLSEHCP